MTYKSFAACILTALTLSALCGCSDKQTENSSAVTDEWHVVSTETLYKSEHAVLYRVEYDSPFYCEDRWFVFDNSGEVMESGVGGRVTPQIEETDGMVSVYISAGSGVGNYKEFFPDRDAESEWYQRIFTANGKVRYSIEKDDLNFDEVNERYKLEEIGVKRDDFVNTDEQLIHNSSAALCRAIKELNIESEFPYNLVIQNYDCNNDIWEITFGQKDVAGGCESVYLDGHGRTLLIVFGE